MIDINLFIFLAAALILTVIIGKFLEKIRIPGIFAALLIGVGLSISNPFLKLTSTNTFSFLANMGMYFLLFLIGYELNIKELIKKAGFIFKSMIFIEFFEAIFGTLLIHFIFGSGWAISVLIAVSFATVGEAILIPILDEFKIVNTKLGQTIIGIGTVDDSVEIATIIVVGILLGLKAGSQGALGLSSIFEIVIIFAALIIATFLIRKVKNLKFKYMHTVFLAAMGLLLLFIGVGQYGDAAAFGALLAGIAVRGIVLDKKAEVFGDHIRMITYGFLGPIFFLSVGLELNVLYIFSSFLIVLLVVVVTNLAKVVASYIVGHKEMGTRQSLLLGVGLSIRFSTSIIIIKILFDGGLIGSNLYSVIVAANIVFNFLVPILFSNLIVRWKKYIK